MKMTKLEQAAKRQIEDILNKQGYPTYSRLFHLFDLKLTDNPEHIGYMIPNKAVIVLNKNLNTDQVSTIVRHEIMHEYLTHGPRGDALKSTNPKLKNIPHSLLNVAADYELSNLGYTDNDKMIARSIQLGDQTLKGLVTEDDHADWLDKSFEEMAELLYDEYKDDEQAMKDFMQRMGGSLDQDLQDAQDLEDYTDDLEQEAQESGDSGSQRKASQLSNSASSVKDDMQKAETNQNEPFNTPKEQAEQAALGKRVEEIKKALAELKDQMQSESKTKIDVERAKKKQKELDKYKRAPIVRFKDSLDKFIKDEIDAGRGKTWTRFNKKYANTGLIRAGSSRLSQAHIPLINVYFDRSGSWDSNKTAEGAKAISTLDKYERQGQIKIKWYYFSNNVHANEQAAIDEGGTYGQPILDHIEATKPNNVIILTDSDINDCTSFVKVPGAVWFLFYDGQSQNLIDHLKGQKLTRIFNMR